MWAIKTTLKCIYYLNILKTFILIHIKITFVIVKQVQQHLLLFSIKAEVAKQYIRKSSNILLL